jgi:monoamine oxidase
MSNRVSALPFEAAGDNRFNAAVNGRRGRALRTALDLAGIHLPEETDDALGTVAGFVIAPVETHNRIVLERNQAIERDYREARDEFNESRRSRREVRSAAQRELERLHKVEETAIAWRNSSALTDVERLNLFNEMMGAIAELNPAAPEAEPEFEDLPEVGEHLAAVAAGPMPL